VTLIPPNVAALIEELHDLREPFSYSASLGGRAAAALEFAYTTPARPMPTVEEVADQIMLLAIYEGREGSVLSSADRDDHQYEHCITAARAVLALFAGEGEGEG
jgi:hypothetical protein